VRPTPQAMTDGFPIVAIIAAYNEADIIGQVVGYLVEQGIGVYLLDHHSTDGTVAAVEPYRGRGLIAVERFPEESGAPSEEATRFSLARIVARKAELAHQVGATWCINHDADEFQEGPWPDLTLRDAIRMVDALGYNAIDFAVLNFWPTHDDLKPGDDIRGAFRFYEPGEAWNRLQIRCWKRQAEPVELASSGGHEAVFPGRRIFPVRFILRHYPIRGQAHGERKVFRERRPRYALAERERGWHVQYEGIGEDHRFVRDPAALTEYDPMAVRRDLIARHRGAEELEWQLTARQQALEASLQALERQLEDRIRAIGDLEGNLRDRDRERELLRAEVATLRGRLDELYSSRSWRWTAPLRGMQRLFRGR